MPIYLRLHLPLNISSSWSIGAEGWNVGVGVGVGVGIAGGMCSSSSSKLAIESSSTAAGIPWATPDGSVVVDLPSDNTTKFNLQWRLQKMKHCLDAARHDLGEESVKSLTA